MSETARDQNAILDIRGSRARQKADDFRYASLDFRAIDLEGVEDAHAKKYISSSPRGTPRLGPGRPPAASRHWCRGQDTSNWRRRADAETAGGRIHLMAVCR
jgi:hypothetical protein